MLCNFIKYITTRPRGVRRVLTTSRTFAHTKPTSTERNTGELSVEEVANLLSGNVPDTKSPPKAEGPGEATA